MDVRDKWIDRSSMAIPNKSSMASPCALRPRIRIMRGPEIALGPGKMDLLESLKKTGSLNKASKHLKMSYMRAWLLIKTMNRCFKKPLVRMTRGGKKGGKAELTEYGRQTLALYKQMEMASVKAMRPSWSKLAKLLKK